MHQTTSRLEWQLKQTIILSIITIFVAQLNLHLFTDNFTISLAAVCFPAFLYLLEDVAIIPLAVISGFGIFGSRVLIHYIQTGSHTGVFTDYMPEIIFYFSMGILLFLFDQLSDHRRKLIIYVPGVILIDYLSNALELFARMQMASYTWHSQLTLVAIACIRGLLLLLLVGSLNRYRILLLNRTHADRYQRLIMLISRLRGEVIWMEKSANMIESTMNTSYALYSDLNEEDSELSKERAKSALTVAKDIHEIKKEYLLIKRGLQEALQSEAESDGLYMTEILTMLTESIRKEYPDKVPLINMEVSNQLYTQDPYVFLSIFHNLFANAIEASEKRLCAISVKSSVQGSDCVFTVHDNGPGIPLKYQDQIFTPRFSTKINYDTGEVNRGLGLSIVRDMVEGNLGGDVCLADSDSGTTFIITIPRERMEAGIDSIQPDNKESQGGIS